MTNEPMIPNALYKTPNKVWPTRPPPTVKMFDVSWTIDKIVSIDKNNKILAVTF